MTKASSFTSRPRFCPQHHPAGENAIRDISETKEATSAACDSELIISAHPVPTHGATSEAQREVTTQKQPLLLTLLTAKD